MLDHVTLSAKCNFVCYINGGLKQIQQYDSWPKSISTCVNYFDPKIIRIKEHVNLRNSGPHYDPNLP